MLGLRKKIIKNIRKIKFDVILDFLILMGIRRKCEKNKTARKIMIEIEQVLMEEVKIFC